MSDHMEDPTTPDEAKLKEALASLAGQTADPERQEPPPSPRAEPTLNELLQALKTKQKAAAVDQVDANVADLAKLLDEIGVAEAAYGKAVDGLRAQAAQLAAEQAALTQSLESELEPEGIQAIKDIVAGKLEEVADAATARDAAFVAVVEKRKAVALAAPVFEAAKAKLDLWRKPADSIAKRLKQAEGLVAEIKKLRNGPNRYEAYWKLAVGAGAAQPSLKDVLAAQPEVIEPGELVERIRAAWTSFSEARAAVAKAAVELATAEAELKAAEATLAARTKNLITAIVDALAEREAAPPAP